MSRSIYFRLLLAFALSLTVAGLPLSSFAQRGGFHGGGGGFRNGGGFHGGSAFRGGGFGAFHGGRSFGGFSGRGFGGYRGSFYRGYGGFYGGYRGYPGFYSGWGFGVGFWPYWGGYPWYGYSPWWGYAPYAYSYPYGYGYGYDPYDYPDRDYDRYPRDRGRRDNRDCNDYRYNCPAPQNTPKGDSAPAKPSSGPSTDSSSGANYLIVNIRTPALPDSGNGEPLRPGLRNALVALRAMPPAARERQLESGRYAGFSSKDRKFLRNQFQPAVPEQVN